MILNQGHKNCINCNYQAAIFRFLEKSELEMVNKSRHEIHYRRGETIFKQGSPVTHVLSFTSGLAKISLETNEKHLIVGLIKPGMFIAGPGVHIHHRHHFSITALTDSSVCAIDQSVFISLLRLNQHFMSGYLQDVNSAYLDVLSRLANQVHKQVNGKIADALLYLSESIFRNSCFPLLLSTKELAELSGVSKESVARTLKEFTDEGVIQINRKELIILLPEILKEISVYG